MLVYENNMEDKCLGERELIARMLEKACKFVESYDKEMLEHLDHSGYHLNLPQNMSIWVLPINFY